MARSLTFQSPLLCILCLLSSIVANTSRLRQTPHNQNLFLGSKAIFRCSGYDLQLLVWFVNDTEYQLAVSQRHTGIEQIYMENTTTNIKTSILNVPAEWVNHESRFSCVGLYRDRLKSTNGYSSDKSIPPALLKVQGPPGKIVNFDGRNISSSTIVLMWDPPSHLPHLKPCCLHYYVNITHFNTSDIIHNDNITSTNITFSINPDRLCDVYIATIGGYNQVGLGDIFVQAWSLGGHFNINNAILSLKYNNAGNLQLLVDVAIFGYCLNDLNNVSLRMDCMDEPPVVAVNDINADSSARSHNTTFNVDIPLSYQDRKCSVDLVLENTVDYQRDIVTYDVVNANYTTGPGYVCINCYYLSQSPALGCHVNVTLIGEDEGISYMTNIARQDRTGCVNVTYEGTYLVKVFDWNRDNTISKNPVFTFNLVSIDAPPLRSPSPSPLPNTPTVIADKLSGGAIGGIAVSSVIFVVVLVVVVILVIGGVMRCSTRNTDKNKVETDGGIDEVDFELVSACSPDQVNGKKELLERVTTLLEGYYGNSDKNFQLYVRNKQKGNYLLIKVSK